MYRWLIFWSLMEKPIDTPNCPLPSLRRKDLGGIVFLFIITQLTDKQNQVLNVFQNRA